MRTERPIAPLRAAPIAAFCLLALAGRQTFAQDFPAGVIQERISFLASDALAGRASGTRGNERAARLVADAFRHDHLRPLGTNRQADARAAGDGHGYFQPFTFTAGVASGRGNRLEAIVGGKRIRYRAGVEFEPSAASGSGKASGELMFAGYGIDSRDPVRDDYAGSDLHGKIVMLLAGVPRSAQTTPLAAYGAVRRKALYARDKGAVALLVVLPQSSDAPHMETDGETSDAGLPILLLRRSVAEQWLQVTGRTLADIEKALEAGPQPFATGLRITLAADVHKVVKTTANVAGMLEGSDPAMRDQVVVIGAHLDHLGMGGPGSLATDRAPAIHHGADDNASGTAGVMALADYFASHRPRPRRSLVFICFSGEELGLLGSQFYTRNPLVPIDRTVAMLNLDMVGRLRDNKLIVVGSGTSPAWSAILDGAGQASGLALSRNEGEFGASDHFPFYTRQVPVLFLFTGLHPDYHRPSDTADKINAEGEARVLRLAADCIERIADLPDRPAFQQVAASATRPPTRYRVSLGTIPDFTAQVEGVQISGVRPGSPADRAGLRAGDIIVRLGQRSVRNLEDMTAALAEHEAGDKVDVVVKRGPETLTLSATLEPGARR